MGIYKRGDTWWYRFNWYGEQIRESTKQGNPRVARQIEAAHKTALAKGEVGIRRRTPAPTLRVFADEDFTPFIESHFKDKPNTLAYYKFGLKRLLDFPPLATARLDTITPANITAFIGKARNNNLEVSSINRQLEVLRRMLKLAMEWGKVDKVLPRVSMLPGQKRRERVLNAAEERQYFDAANAIACEILESFERALKGIRATKRGEDPIKPQDPYVLRDLATLLIDCGLRPEEAYRLRWDEVRDGSLHISHGKTANARRVIPLPARSAAILDMRRTVANSHWVFPAQTKSGHIEQSTIKKVHSRASALAGVADFPPYTLRHTCLTRWAEVMDPYTLAYLAGHSDFATTRRYVHPRKETVLEAMGRAQKAQGWAQIEHNHGELVAEPAEEKPEPIENLERSWCARRDSNPRPIGSKPIALSS
jgi:integrase